MRIGIEVQRLFRRKKHGMEVVALELIRELQQIDTINDYILYCKDDDDQQCIRQSENLKINMFSAGSYATWEQVQLPMKVKKDNLDMLHSTCNTSSILSGVPLILTLHDIIFLENIDFNGTPYQNFGNLYRRFVVPKIVAKSSAIITVSNYEKKMILDRFDLPNDSVTVIHNAVNAKFNTLYSEDVLNSFRLKHNLPNEFILFLGNTAPKKNTMNVIKSYIQYKEAFGDGIPLVILDYDKSLVFEILGRLGKQKYEKDFVFPGYVSSDDMPLLYNISKLFLYPSLRESFGLPILEAMACGVPVITSNTSSMPEVAGSAAELVDPLNCSQITQKIVEVLGNQLLCLEMRREGLIQASKFTWKSSAEQLLTVYNSVYKKVKT